MSGLRIIVSRGEYITFCGTAEFSLTAKFIISNWLSLCSSKLFFDTFVICRGKNSHTSRFPVCSPSLMFFLANLWESFISSVQCGYRYVLCCVCAALFFVVLFMLLYLCLSSPRGSYPLPVGILLVLCFRRDVMFGCDDVHVACVLILACKCSFIRQGNDLMLSQH